MKTDISKVTAAVNYLIVSPSYARIINEMTGIIEKWETHPMVYGPSLDHLNALIDVGLANRDAFEALLKLAQRKRSQLPKAKRQDYQRQLMRERRLRVNRAVALREGMFGKMTQAKRADYIKDLQLRWGEEKDKFLKARGKMTWSEKNEAIAAFWQGVDRKLEANLADLRKG
jgi:hypothetical protein